MNIAQRRTIEEHLRRELRELRETHAFDPADSLALERCADQADHAGELLRTHVDLAMRARGLEKHRALEQALDEVWSPGFGACRECGEPIAMARLTANPAARFCVDCQDRRERRYTACA